MKSTKIKNYTTKNGTLKVGIISDTQLPPFKKRFKKSDVFCRNLRNALTVLKERGADVILFAGDIGDLGTRFAFQLYVDIIDEVYGDDKPIIQTIMGNHDYWSKDLFTWRPHKKTFVDVVGHSPWTHYSVNGYHFIGASPDSGNMKNGYKKTLEWIENEIIKAEKDSPDKPIFVMTHNQPENTCYGAEDWGDKQLHKAFDNHPNVISLSGHSHYSILDERSIWQGKYTVFSTQSLSYTELEPGKENGTIPPNADSTPMGFLMEFEEDNIFLRRINFATGKEEKPTIVGHSRFPIRMTEDMLSKNVKKKINRQQRII